MATKVISKTAFLTIVREIVFNINDTNFNDYINNPIYLNGLKVYGIEDPKTFIKELLNVSYEIYRNNTE